MNREVALLVTGAIIAATSFGYGFSLGKANAEVKVVTVQPPASAVQAVAPGTEAIAQVAQEPVQASPEVVQAAAVQPVAPVGDVRQVSFNTSSKKYHEPSCKWAGCGNCESTSLASALSQGGVPCKVCH